MPDLTPNLGLIKPLGGEFVKISDFNTNFDRIDADAGITICTSATRPSGSARYPGMQIYETNTSRAYFWDGSAWLLNPGFSDVESYTSDSTTWLPRTDVIGSQIICTLPVPTRSYRRKFRLNVNLLFQTSVPTTGAQAQAQRWNLALGQGISSVNDATSRTAMTFAPLNGVEYSTAFGMLEGYVPSGDTPNIRVFIEQTGPSATAGRAPVTVGSSGSYNRAYVELWPA